VAGINAGERPLGLYVYSQDMQVAEDMLKQPTSGGTCVNVCAVQGALPALVSVGWGRAAMGDTTASRDSAFSNPRGVVVRGTGDLPDAFLPRTGAWRKPSWTVCSPAQGPPGQPRQAVPERWIRQRWIEQCGRRAA
jgi:hypothetical protein